jgi:hypothetical protein
MSKQPKVPDTLGKVERKGRELYCKDQKSLHNRGSLKLYVSNYLLLFIIAILVWSYFQQQSDEDEIAGNTKYNKPIIPSSKSSSSANVNDILVSFAGTSTFTIWIFIPIMLIIFYHILPYITPPSE